MNKLLISLLLLVCISAVAQPTHYTVADAHSHNDYEQPIPFYTAYKAGFGSIDADIFLVHGSLMVAHDFIELQKNRSMEEYYLKPLVDFVEKNNGHAYADTGKQLQMLIDIKTGPTNTLDSFIVLLEKYPVLINCPSIKWVITGNRPPDSLFASYPSFIWFDGLFKKYDEQELQKIVMISDDFKNYSHWDGTGEICPEDGAKLIKAIAWCHVRYKKKVRFWDAPDTPNAWKQFMQFGVDYINTDHIEALEEYLK